MSLCARLRKRGEGTGPGRTLRLFGTGVGEALGRRERGVWDGRRNWPREEATGSPGGSQRGSNRPTRAADRAHWEGLTAAGDARPSQAALRAHRGRLSAAAAGVGGTSGRPDRGARGRRDLGLARSRGRREDRTGAGRGAATEGCAGVAGSQERGRRRKRAGHVVAGHESAASLMRDRAEV